MCSFSFFFSFFIRFFSEWWWVCHFFVHITLMMLAQCVTFVSFSFLLYFFSFFFVCIFSVSHLYISVACFTHYSLIQTQISFKRLLTRYKWQCLIKNDINLVELLFSSSSGYVNAASLLFRSFFFVHLRWNVCSSVFWRFIGKHQRFLFIVVYVSKFRYIFFRSKSEKWFFFWKSFRILSLSRNQ